MTTQLDCSRIARAIHPGRQVDAQRIARLRWQYEAYKRLDDTDDEDLIAFLQIYAELRAADVPLPPEEVLAIDKFIRENSTGADIEQAEREENGDEVDAESMRGCPILYV